MKIYVCTDLEGMAGVVNWEQTGREGKGAEYERARRLLTQEVNTVVAACLDAGAENVVVLDGHATGYNFIVEDLHPGGEYITGANRKQSLEGLTDEFAGMILLGYHAMAGTEDGVLNHTQSSTSWYNYWVNEVKLGEIGQCAILAGHRNVPVILVTGDAAACREAKALLPQVETVAVKEGYTRTCARIVPPAKAHGMIREGVQRALARLASMKPYEIKYPAQVRIEFQTTEVADGYERSGWKRINGTTVEKRVERPANGMDLKIY